MLVVSVLCILIYSNNFVLLSIPNSLLPDCLNFVFTLIIIFTSVRYSGCGYESPQDPFLGADMASYYTTTILYQATTTERGIYINFGNYGFKMQFAKHQPHKRDSSFTILISGINNYLLPCQPYHDDSKGTAATATAVVRRYFFGFCILFTPFQPHIWPTIHLVGSWLRPPKQWPRHRNFVHPPHYVWHRDVPRPSWVAPHTYRRVDWRPCRVW